MIERRMSLLTISSSIRRPPCRPQRSRDHNPNRRRNPNDAPDADYTGYDFWLNKLNQFNGNFVNAEMVNAFISSDEYRQRFLR